MTCPPPVNIHSHLWGAIVFAYFLSTYYQNYVEVHAMATWKDAAVFAIFLSAAIICLMASAFYHTSGCHSKEVRIQHVSHFRPAKTLFASHQAATYCHAYDYSGIIILIVGSFFPSIYYGFYCEPHIQKLYLTSMTLAGLGTFWPWLWSPYITGLRLINAYIYPGAAYIVLNPEYAKPTHRGARTTVFIALGLGAIIPISHKFLTEGFDTLMNEMGAFWLILSGALYIVGAVL